MSWMESAMKTGALLAGTGTMGITVVLHLAGIIPASYLGDPFLAVGLDVLLVIVASLFGVFIGNVVGHTQYLIEAERTGQAPLTMGERSRPPTRFMSSIQNEAELLEHLRKGGHVIAYYGSNNVTTAEESLRRTFTASNPFQEELLETTRKTVSANSPPRIGGIFLAPNPGRNQAKHWGSHVYKVEFFLKQFGTTGTKSASPVRWLDLYPFEKLTDLLIHDSIIDESKQRYAEQYWNLKGTQDQLSEILIDPTQVEIKFLGEREKKKATPINENRSARPSNHYPIELKLGDTAITEQNSSTISNLIGDALFDSNDLGRRFENENQAASQVEGYVRTIFGVIASKLPHVSPTAIDALHIKTSLTAFDGNIFEGQISIADRDSVIKWTYDHGYLSVESISLNKLTTIVQEFIRSAHSNDELRPEGASRPAPPMMSTLFFATLRGSWIEQWITSHPTAAVSITIAIVGIPIALKIYKRARGRAFLARINATDPDRPLSPKEWRETRPLAAYLKAAEAPADLQSRHQLSSVAKSEFDDDGSALKDARRKQAMERELETAKDEIQIVLNNLDSGRIGSSFRAIRNNLNTDVEVNSYILRLIEQLTNWKEGVEFNGSWAADDHDFPEIARVLKFAKAKRCHQGSARDFLYVDSAFQTQQMGCHQN